MFQQLRKSVAALLIGVIYISPIIESTGRSVEPEHDYCIVGGGPAGLQLAYLMQTSGDPAMKYTVFERHAFPGSFFERYPRHRKLISINKRHTGRANADFKLRHDWNSLLVRDNVNALRFADFDESYFPHADSLVNYLNYFEQLAPLNIQYNTTVRTIQKMVGNSSHSQHDRDDGYFIVRTKDSSACEGSAGCERLASTTCRRVVVTTGFHKAYVPFPPTHDPDQVVEHYESVSLNASAFDNKEVLVLGKGNAALEIARQLLPHTARIHVVSRSRVHLSWETHYVGSLRAMNMQILESYQLKSMDTLVVEDAAHLAFERDPHSGRIRVYHTDTNTSGGACADSPETCEGGMFEEEATHISPVDHVVVCTGWQFDDTIFAVNSTPRMKTRKYPELTSSFESVNVPGLFFAGTLAHGRDWKRSSGGFIHGFRYTARALYRYFRVAHHASTWPSPVLASVAAGHTSSVVMPSSKGSARCQTLRLAVSTLARKLLYRINTMSGPYQMFGSLLDILLLNATTAEDETLVSSDTVGRVVESQRCVETIHLDESKCCSEGDCSMHGRYFSEVPADFAREFIVHHAHIPSTAMERFPRGSKVAFLTLALEYGSNFSGDGKDVFDPAHTDAGENIEHPDGPGIDSKFLHPVLRVHRVVVPDSSTSAEADAIDRYLEQEVATRGTPSRDDSFFASTTPKLLQTLCDEVELHGMGICQSVCYEGSSCWLDATDNNSSNATDASSSLQTLWPQVPKSPALVQALHRLICPESGAVGRSICFDHDVTAVHHMLEESKFEWWDADNHVRPLVEFLARVMHDPNSGDDDRLRFTDSEMDRIALDVRNSSF
eukprot:m.1226997 g.1226997  ORF g.1226997 m.1226997 type:complete len:835 (+) comp24641_c2_seq6:269-2773(+)